MNRNRFTVLIPDGEEILALHVARCLAQLRKINVYVLSGKRWAWSRFSRQRRRYEFIPVRDNHDKRIEVTADMIKQYGIDVLLPVSNEGIEAVAKKNHLLSDIVSVTPIPELQTFKMASNKWLLYQFAQEHLLPVPESWLVTLDSQFYEQLSKLDYPILLKPIIGGGGEGIQKFETPIALEAFLEKTPENEIKNKYILQNYIPGIDFGLSVLCRRGAVLAHTVQEGLNAQYFGPLKTMQFVEQEEVVAHGHKLLEALNWEGVAHIDMRYDIRERRIKILEVNGRYWGSLMASLVAGVNFPHLACLAALEVPFAKPNYQLRKYLHTGIAARELILRSLKKTHLNDFSFKETGLRFLLTDPLPETIYSAAKLVHRHKHRLIPKIISRLADEVLS